MRYLLITFFKKPTGQIDEQIHISKKLKLSDDQMCNIIMDFAEKKIVKGVVEGKVIEKDWNRIYEYYKKIYPTLIEQLDKNNEVTQ